MKMKFFWIMIGDTSSEAELNEFLSSRRLLQVDRHFTENLGNPGWAVCVEYHEKTEQVKNGGARKVVSKVDYKEVLDEESFQIFSDLRAWRKKKAEEESIPVYTIATNEQIATVAKLRITTKEKLKQVDGYGEARMRKYGAEMLLWKERAENLLTLK